VNSKRHTSARIRLLAFKTGNSGRSSSSARIGFVIRPIKIVFVVFASRNDLDHRDYENVPAFCADS